MPAFNPRQSTSRRESWPPTQYRLQHSFESEHQHMPNSLDLSYIDSDPLNYFLAPAPALSDDDDEDLDMLDAGIEDAKRPAPTVRSISPSKLGGSRLAPPMAPPPAEAGSPRPSTPELYMETISTPDADEEETYFSFGGKKTSALHAFGLPFTLKDFTAARTIRKASKAVAASPGLLSPPHSPLHVPASTRGRPTYRLGHRSPGAAPRRAMSWGPGGQQRRLAPRAWREPSPDVWSIEEEPEEESADDTDMEHKSSVAKVGPKDIPGATAKPRKKVRFVLPVEEI